MATTAFQTQVHSAPAKGVPGDKASLNPAVYTDRNYVSGDASVSAGNFVWDDPSNPEAGEYHGSGIFKALSSGLPGAQPLGIVERNLSYGNLHARSGGSLAVPEHSALNVVQRGAVYVHSGTAATKGQKVFALLADGSVHTADAGSTVAGAVETGWTVVEGGAASGPGVSPNVITISNWSA